MKARQFLKKNLQTAIDNAKEYGQNILRAQGHNASGKLIDSFETRLSDTGEKLSAGLFVLEYGLYQSTGVVARNIKYNPFWLLPWAKQIMPNLSEAEATSFVFAVWNKHKKVGMHTQESKAFSSTGERDSWIERMDEQVEKEIQEVLKIEEAFLMVIEEFVIDSMNVAV